ncbi:MAG: acyl carrier protein [Chakrabartia sp.]
MTNSDQVDERLRLLLQDGLGLASARVARLTPNSPLFGALPELDSLAAVNLLAELETAFAIRIAPEDRDQDFLTTYGKLHQYIIEKLNIYDLD